MSTSLSKPFVHQGRTRDQIAHDFDTFEREAEDLIGGPLSRSVKFINEGQAVELTLTRVEPMATLRDMLGGNQPAKEIPMKKSVLGLGRLKGVMDELRNDVRKEVDGAVVLAESVKADATKAVDGFKQTLSDVREEVASVVDELNQVTNGGPE